MRKNRDLLIAACAIIFYNVVSPVVATAGEWLQTWMNVRIGELGVELNNIAANSEDLQTQCGATNAIGFQVFAEPDCNEE